MPINKTTSGNLLNKLNSTALAQPIILQTETNQEIQLTSEKMERWFANVERNRNIHPENSDNKFLCLELISQFGLTTLKQVFEFLNSPLGKQIEGLIKKDLIAMAIMEEKQYLKMLEDQRLHDRRMAFILLGMTIREQRKSDQLNEAIQQQIDKILHKKTNTSEKKPQEVLKDYHRKIALYDEVLSTYSDVFDEKVKEKEDIENGIKLIQKRLQEIDNRYALLSNNLINDSYLKSLSNVLTPQIIEERLTKLEQLFSNQSAYAHPFYSLTPEQQSAFLIRRVLTQRLAVMQGNKMYDHNGEETPSFERATYVLEPTQRIVNFNGIFYLIGIHQNVNEMPEADKSEAQLRFERSAPRYFTAQKTLTYNQQQEKQPATEQMAALKSRLKPLKVEIAAITRQMELIRTIKNAMQEELEKAEPNLQKLNKLQKSAPQLVSQMGELRAQKLQDAFKQLNLKPTATSLYNFKLAFRNAGGNSETIKKALNEIKPGQPIPPQTMNFLQKTVNALNTPETKKLEEKIAPSTAPTPFSITPNPLKTK